ncbi:MAG: hypothetical protein K2O32_04400 [Acetatifactor sp.]|nr:hypothetical protein [Acetatifactor sp.]
MGIFDTADNMAIDTIWQKYTFRQKSGVSGIVCREKIKRNRILWILAERYIILSASTDEKWEIWFFDRLFCATFIVQKMGEYVIIYNNIFGGIMRWIIGIE